MFPDIGTFSGGRSGLDSYSFEFTVPRFLSIAGKIGEGHRCSKFSAWNVGWVLFVYPHGITSSCVAVSLHVLRTGPLNLDLTLGILGTEEDVRNRKNRSMQFSEDDRECIWNEFVKRSDLEAEKDLVLTLNMKMHETVGLKRLAENLGNLLVSGKHSDVSVLVGEAEFAAHRTVLSARCPNFILEGCPANGKIRLPMVFEPDIFRAFLEFLYTGSIRSLADRDAFALYRLSHVYDVGELKSRCLEHIIDTISEGNFCDVVELAIDRVEHYLLERAIEFAAGHTYFFEDTEQWRRFARDNPKPAKDILDEIRKYLE